MKNTNRSSSGWYFFAAVLVVATAIRIVAAVRRPLYVDEGLSLSISAMPLNQEAAFLRNDFNPPLLFNLVHGLELIHSPIWFIRVAMALLGVISVGLLMMIVRQWSTPRSAMIAGAFAAVMPSLILYDGWVRMYSLLNTLCLGAFLLLSIVAVQHASKMALVTTWIAWVGTITASLYTHYLAWFALAGQIGFAASRGARFLLQTLALGLLAVLLWLPQLSTFLHQLGGGGISFGWFRSHLFLGLIQLPSQATLDPEVEGWPSNFAAGLVWIWVVAALYLAWPKMKSGMLPWLASTAVLTVCYSVVAHKYLYDARYFLLFAYALAAWTGLAIVELYERFKKGVAFAGLLGFAVAVMGCAYAFDSGFYTTDWPTAAAEVRAHAEPGDLLIFEPGAGNWAFIYYADERPYTVWMVSTPQDIDSAVARVGGQHRVWLIGSGIAGIDPGLRLLGVLQHQFRLVYFDERSRLLPSQDVQVGLFVHR